MTGLIEYYVLLYEQFVFVTHIGWTHCELQAHILFWTLSKFYVLWKHTLNSVFTTKMKHIVHICIFLIYV